MKRHIWLRDLDHLPVLIDGVFVKYDFTAEEVAAARERLAKRGLRFDNLTGHTRDSEGVIEQFRQFVSGTPEQMANPTAWSPYQTVEEVMQWEFRRNILSEAARQRRLAADP